VSVEIVHANDVAGTKNWDELLLYESTELS
jgi:hypothetical protein